jgi:prophage antirepressor-like protein
MRLKTNLKINKYNIETLYNFNKMIEEIKTDNNCIVKAFENCDISILHENINNKKVYYFKASDIGKALNLSNIRASIQNYDEDEQVVRKAYDLRGCKQDTTFLSSQGVYRLLYNSKKEGAKKFRKWAGNILDDIIFNESAELRKQLEEHKILLIENKQELLLNNFDKDTIVYLIKISENLYKFGNTDNIKRRFNEHRREINDNIQLIFCIDSKNNTLLEQKLKEYLKNTNYRKELKINDKLQTELVEINNISIIENQLTILNKNIDENKEHLEIKKLQLELEILKLKLEIENKSNENKNDTNENTNKSSYILLNTNEHIKEDFKTQLVNNIENENNMINQNKDNLLEYIDEKIDEHIDTELEIKIKNLKTIGVSIKKNRKGEIKYQGSLKFENKTYFCGYHKNKIEAALAYNKKALEICGDKAKLNIIPDDILNSITIKKPLPIIPYTFVSKYFGVKVRNNRYRSNVYFQAKEYYCGTYDTEIEAALAYNIKIKELYGDNYKQTKINVFSDEILKQYANFKIQKIDKPLDTNKIKKYIGVSYQDNKFNARFTFNKKTYYIGRFDTELEAVKAYNKKALEICGDKAKLNII